jgi:hypothetical protein
MANDMTPDSRLSVFDPVRFFEGRSVAYGLFEDRRGRVRRKMTVQLVGTRRGDTLTLDEQFFYDDGTTEQRTWTMTREGGSSFKASSPDCVGEAVGTAGPQSSRMVYDFKLKMPKSGRSIVVSFDDRMHQVSDTLVINRATVSKWGFRVGEVYLVMQKAA